MNEQKLTVDWTQTTEREEIEKLILRYMNLSDTVAKFMIEKAEKELGLD